MVVTPARSPGRRSSLQAVVQGACVVGLVATLASAGGLDAPRIDRDALDRAVKAAVAEHGADIRTGIWIGGPEGPAWFSSQPGSTFPTASAIKTAFLVELFDRYSDSLDRPPPGLEAVLRDDHPAVAHFSGQQRDEVRKALGNASVRRLGGVMMGSIPTSNVVYNAAANAVTAVMGGPEALTRAIRARDPAFAPIAVRRYMLAARDVTGDNEATPEALAAVLQRLAAREVPGIAAATVDTIRRTMISNDDRSRGRHFVKTGELSSDPLTCVKSGWYERGDRVIVYVVMTTQRDPGRRPRADAYRQLDATTAKLTDIVLRGVRGEQL